MGKKAKKKTLSVYASGGKLCMDADYIRHTGRRRYIGRTEVFAWKEEDLPDDVPCHVHENEFLEPGEVPIPHVAYPAKDQPESVVDSAYIRKMVANGSLLPADAETAKVCGVPFYDNKKEHKRKSRDLPVSD